VLFISINVQLIVNFPFERGRGNLTVKPRIRETGESSETIIRIIVYALSLTKLNNWFVLDFLPRIINLVQLEDEEELQKKNINES
jgi:hypothetical protein